MKKIVIDAGHGGKDPGACGTVLREKDVVLKIAKMLQVKLVTSGFSVLMTRADDTFVELQNRAKIANDYGADLFISIHCNAAENKAAGGVETLLYANTGENAKIGKLIQDGIISAMGLINRGVKERPDLAVLRLTKMTAVLVECGFISNAAEHDLLSRDAYLEKIAAAMSNAVRDYFGVSTANAESIAVFKGFSNTEAAARILELVKPNALSAGLFPSVKAAQLILESNYLKSELAQNANNGFGMKKSLSGNAWPGSVWDGSSVYAKETAEHKPDGTVYTVTADFRKYSRIDDSIADHSAYLLGAKNGNALRYAGITGAPDYRAQISIIKDGGYATDVNYVEKVCGIIEKYGLDKYDAPAEAAIDLICRRCGFNSPDYWKGLLKDIPYFPEFVTGIARVIG